MTQTDFLLMTLGGPMSAWGNITVGEIRSTWDRPSKSAVLGLVAAALGIERLDTATQIALQKAFGIAVGTVDRHGPKPLLDYHSVQSRGQERNAHWRTRKDELVVPRSQLNTLLSQRAYWEDRTAVIAIWQRASCPTSLAQMRDALLAPQYMLWLGRKSCPPGQPLAPEIIDARSLHDAVDAYWTAHSQRCAEHHLPDVDLPLPEFFWVDDGCPGLDRQPYLEREVRRDDVRDRRQWHFSDRFEYRYNMNGADHVS